MTGRGAVNATEECVRGVTHPYSYLAGIALSRGNILAATRLVLKGVILGVKITKKDRADPRLLGMGAHREVKQ